MNKFFIAFLLAGLFTLNASALNYQDVSALPDKSVAQHVAPLIKLLN